MVRVPGSSGDSRFHRESPIEEVKIKTEARIEAPAVKVSPKTRKKEKFTDCQSFGRGFEETKIKEEDRSHDLEENSQLLPVAPLGATANRTVKRSPQDESPKGILKRFSFILEMPSEMMKAK